MSLWRIATRNIWQNRGRYVAYLASSAFSVMIYFLYSALIYHPDLQSGYRGAGYVVQGMKAGSYVIAIFTALFLLYSNSAFVRSRMKEFGLLTLLGVSRPQLVWIILCESAVVAVVALAAGLGAGMLFLKLFFMAISAVLHLDGQIPLYAGPRVWIQTLAIFGGLFFLVSLASLRSVLRRNIVELVRAGRQPKGAPTFSRRKAILGVSLILLGYAWAAIPHPIAVILGVVPVTAIVSVGTYFLMREASIAFLTWLHGKARFFYRPGPFLNVSQLVYKLQDNYRVLSAVAILVGAILGTVGAVAAMYVVVTEDSLGLTPQAVQLLEPAPGEVDRVEGALAEAGVTGLTYRELNLRTARLEKQGFAVALLPYSFYAGVERPRADGPLTLSAPDQAILVYPAEMKGSRAAPTPAPDLLVLGDQSQPLQVIPDQAGRVLNPGPKLDFMLVLPDARFAELVQQAPAEERLKLSIWSGESWASPAMKKAVPRLRNLYPEEGAARLTMAVEANQLSISTMGVALFVAVFVSLVFFAACFSLLYFRLFTEMDEDRKYFRRLQQVGVSDPELKQLALRQAGVIFFVPFATGLIHSTFAMYALGTLTGQVVLQYGWAVAVAYLLLYLLCFRATANFYWRSLKPSLT